MRDDDCVSSGFLQGSQKEGMVSGLMTGKAGPPPSPPLCPGPRKWSEDFEQKVRNRLFIVQGSGGLLRGVEALDEPQQTAVPPQGGRGPRRDGVPGAVGELEPGGVAAWPGL